MQCICPVRIFKWIYVYICTLFWSAIKSLIRMISPVGNTKMDCFIYLYWVFHGLSKLSIGNLVSSLYHQILEAVNSPFKLTLCAFSRNSVGQTPCQAFDNCNIHPTSNRRSCTPISGGFRELQTRYQHVNLPKNQGHPLFGCFTDHIYIQSHRNFTRQFLIVTSLTGKKCNNTARDSVCRYRA